MSILNGSEFQRFQNGNVLPVDKITAINSSQNNFDMVSKQIGGKKSRKTLKKTKKHPKKYPKKHPKKHTKKNKPSMKIKKSKKIKKMTLKKRIMKIFGW